jgi:hypothetical protein
MTAVLANNGLGRLAESSSGRSKPGFGPESELCARWEYRRQPHISGRISGRKSEGWRRFFLSFRKSSFLRRFAA